MICTGVFLKTEECEWMPVLQASSSHVIENMVLFHFTCDSFCPCSPGEDKHQSLIAEKKTPNFPKCAASHSFPRLEQKKCLSYFDTNFSK
jgi:hypothetical protein